MILGVRKYKIKVPASSESFLAMFLLREKRRKERENKEDRERGLFLKTHSYRD